VVGIAGSLHLIDVEVEAALSYKHFCSHTLRKFLVGSVSKRVLTPAVPFISNSQPPLKEHTKFLELEAILNFYKANNAKGTVRDCVNEFKMASSSKNLVCSFNGGCEFEMKGTAGVKTLFDTDPTKNFLNVCEQKCLYDKAASTSTSIKCKLPAIPTTYSN
jgi:hypothetical protein